MNCGFSHSAERGKKAIGCEEEARISGYKRIRDKG
jgi:hypothetical protein